MPRPNSLIADVWALSTAREARQAGDGRFVTVTFGAGRTGLLDVTNHQGRVWAEVMQSLHETGKPAYVEIDPDTELITNLLLPRSFTVTALRREKDRLEVELDPSQATHVVLRSNPHYEEIAKVLEQARKRGSRVLVTEGVSSPGIVDARPQPEHGQTKR